MSEEQKRLIDETVENLKCLDKISLLIIKSGSELLKARDCLCEDESNRPSKEEVSDKCQP